MIAFTVRGSKTDHQIVVEQTGTNFRMTCDCSAGSHAQLCHHRIELLDGKSDAVLSENREDVARVKALFQNSAAWHLYQTIRTLEQQKVSIDQELKRNRKLLGHMLGS